MLLRTHVSRTAAGKGNAVLEGVGLDTKLIRACFNSNPKKEQEAVQEGLITWTEGQGRQPATWAILIEAMEYAEIGIQPIKDLKKKLGIKLPKGKGRYASTCMCCDNTVFDYGTRVVEACMAAFVASVTHAPLTLNLCPVLVRSAGVAYSID